VNNKKRARKEPFFYCFKNVPDAIICRQVQQEPVPEQELQQASGPPLSSGIQ
jgi:hypothetical protein